MRTRAMLATTVLWLGGIAGCGGLALADQTDPRLDPLFAQLKAVDNADAARPIEAQIWALWLQSNNEAVDQLMALGVALMNAGDFRRALATFDRVVKLAPAFSEGWNKRATTLYLMGQYAESISDIDRVLALEPRHFGALSGLGLCDTRLHRNAEALEAFRRAITVDPNMRDVERSIEELKKLVGEESI